MKNHKIIPALLALGIITQTQSSELYTSQSEAESTEHGREPNKPLTTPLPEATTKKQKKNKIASALNKDAQKEFREALAGYRGMYTLQQLLEKTGGKEVKAEKRLRLDLENKLNKYKTEHGNDPYIEKKLKRLENFKNEEIPNRFKQLSK